MRILPCLLIVVAACGGTEPVAQPCIDCPNIAGRYVERRAKQEVTCSDGSTLFVEAKTTPVTLEQEGSRLTVPGEGWIGSLKADLSVAFDGYRTYAVNLETGAHSPGFAFLTGQFGAPDATGRRTMNATFSFVEDKNQCRINAVSAWEPQ